MSFVRTCTLGALSLLGCSASHLSPTSRPAPSPLHTQHSSPSRPVTTPPPSPTALGTVAALLPSLTVFSPSESAWLPPRILSTVISSTHLLPVPSAPRPHSDGFIWSLITADPYTSDNTSSQTTNPLSAACSALATLDSRLSCATDTVTLAGTHHARIAIAWRTTGPPPEVSWIQPLRALALYGTDLCLVSAQRTVNTLDLTVLAPSASVLGRSLAVITAAPRLSDLIVVRVEPVTNGLRALLSWPTARAHAPHADLHSDPWPTRCNNSVTVAQDTPVGGHPTAIEPIDGSTARGAVVSLNRTSWVVTSSDTFGEYTVVSTDSRSVTLRSHRRRLPLRLPFTPR